MNLNHSRKVFCPLQLIRGMLLALCASTLHYPAIWSFDFGETIRWFGGVRSLSSPIGLMPTPSWAGRIRATGMRYDKLMACSRTGPSASGTITRHTVGWSNWNRSVVTVMLSGPSPGSHRRY